MPSGAIPVAKQPEMGINWEAILQCAPPMRPGLEKRRSDRLMLTIPLAVEGLDAKGQPFKDEARTISLNRHGARIRIERPLRVGQTIVLTNLVGRRQAEFRVVGPVAPVTERGGEWGVEYLDMRQNIWGIQFPPPGDAVRGNSKALLECRQCQSVTLMRISLVELEVLETSGLLIKPCTICEQETPWGHAEKQVAMTGPPEESAMMPEAQAAAHRVDRRKHRRIALQMPVLIRDYYGGSEITKTENVSKGGFCFVSERQYQVGAGLLVVCPYKPGTPNIEVRARVVRSQGVEGTERRVYGVRYEL